MEYDPVENPASQGQGSERTKAPSTLSRILWILLGLAIVAALLVGGRELGSYIPRFKEWVGSVGVWGPVVFMLGYAVAVVVAIPASALTLAAGAIFGVVEGTLYTLVGATLGATAAFWVARYLARGVVERRIEGDARFAAIDRAIAAEGRKIVLLLRLSPAFPFNLLNYALGLTRVRTLDYVVASVGMLPGTLLYVYSGKIAGDVAAAAAGAGEGKSPAEIALIVVGLAATVAVTVTVTRIARRALGEATTA